MIDLKKWHGRPTNPRPFCRGVMVTPTHRYAMTGEIAIRVDTHIPVSSYCAVDTEDSSVSVVDQLLLSDYIPIPDWYKGIILDIRKQVVGIALISGCAVDLKYYKLLTGLPQCSAGWIMGKGLVFYGRGYGGIIMQLRME